MKVRIWEERSGRLVGEVEQQSPLDIIWFSPSYSSSMTERPDEPGHYDIVFKTISRGRYLMTHAYLGIPSLPYGREKDKEQNEVGSD